jgi:hypothetical protein
MAFQGMTIEEARDRIVARCMRYGTTEVVEASRNRVVCSRKEGGLVAALSSTARNTVVFTLAAVDGQVRAQGRAYFETNGGFYGQVLRSEYTDVVTAQHVSGLLAEAGAVPI